MKLYQLLNFLFCTSIKCKINKVKKIFEIKSINDYVPNTNNQINYVKSLKNPNIDLLFCLGPAGTGKTLFACKHAIQELKSNKKSKIIITRPTVSIEEDMGFLPGNINQKMYPWTIPIFDIFEEYYSKIEIKKLLLENIIEIAPLGYMQGRTFKNSIIIADEMQNSSPSQMFMLLTRIGDNSKMIITGDLIQTTNELNGLNDIIKKINYDDIELNKKKIDIIKMQNFDIKRHEIVKTIYELYKL